ncbi:formyltransferase family protein [Metasolibacillus sp. FSL H7-0170]|uniref:methionyl-tRNA formyltransferase n=1 Tax=Metasolibacillus sp. FSL H7-0170 TaxID=2921431 RepID=UPI003159057B
MKILYIGCVRSSFVFLDAIYNNTHAEIIGVVTKTKSNYNADHCSLHHFCEENQIDWLDYRDNEQLLEWVKVKEPDIIYCFGWSYLLPNEIYQLPMLGAVGYHPTLLPQNRGRHPIIWTIALGLRETGSSFFYLTDVPDAGDILSQRRLVLDEFEDANTLYEKLLFIGKEQVIDLTNSLIDRTLIPISQDESKATYWRKRGKHDGRIDWRMSSNAIRNLVNALTRPYIGAHFEYEGKDIIVWKVEQLNAPYIQNIEPGKIIEANSDSFIIRSGDKLIKVLDFEGEFVPKEGIYL